MKVFRYIVLSFFVFSFVLGSKIAVVTKVKGLVEIMPTGKTEFYDLTIHSDREISGLISGRLKT